MLYDLKTFIAAVWEHAEDNGIAVQIYDAKRAYTRYLGQDIIPEGLKPYLEKWSKA